MNQIYHELNLMRLLLIVVRKKPLFKLSKYLGQIRMNMNHNKN